MNTAKLALSAAATFGATVDAQDFNRDYTTNDPYYVVCLCSDAESVVTAAYSTSGRLLGRLTFSLLLRAGATPTRS